MVVVIGASLRFPRLMRSVARSRRSTGARDQPAVIARPMRRCHDLRGPGPSPSCSPSRSRGVPAGDLGTRPHRQPTPHASPRSPFRGHAYLRHGRRFAGGVRKSPRRGSQWQHLATVVDRTTTTAAQRLRQLARSGRSAQPATEPRRCPHAPPHRSHPRLPTCQPTTKYASSTECLPVRESWDLRSPRIPYRTGTSVHLRHKSPDQP